MHGFEIAEHGIEEREIAYYSKVKIRTGKEFNSIRAHNTLQIKHFKLKKYLKKNIKKNRKMFKRLKRLIFPSIYNPRNIVT